MPGLRKALLACSVLATAAGGPAFAETPNVAVSIKPLHSLVSAVMQGVGEPTLIVRSIGSEHVYSLRPSDAEALQSADIVFWAGKGMETFLEKPLSTLSGGARVVEVSKVPGLKLLPFREVGPFEAHDHGHAEEGDVADAGRHSHEDDHHDRESAATGDSPDHDHGASGNHDHASEADAGSDHDHSGEPHAHGEHDLHVWLDPDNAKVIVASVAETLAAADPENAARYAANASAYAERLDALARDIDRQLDTVRGRPYVVFHDAYQYFEERFDIPATGSITVSPETLPGVQRLTEIRAKIKELDAACVFSEPQFEPRLVGVVTDGTDARTGVLDPLGAEIPDGPDLYPTLIGNLATSLKTCLAEPS